MLLSLHIKKHIMKYIFRFSVFFALISLTSLSAFAADISDVNVIDTQDISLKLSEDVQLPVGKIEADVDVLHDDSIANVTADPQDKKKVTLTLSTPLKAKTDYSLLTVFGADGSIDFTTGDTIVP